MPTNKKRYNIIDTIIQNLALESRIVNFGQEMISIKCVLIWKKILREEFIIFLFHLQATFQFVLVFSNFEGNFNYLTHRSFKLKFEWERRAGFSAIFVDFKAFSNFSTNKIGRRGPRKSALPL